jgi:hypothetical protein
MYPASNSSTVSFYPIIGKKGKEKPGLHVCRLQGKVRGNRSIVSFPCDSGVGFFLPGFAGLSGGRSRTLSFGSRKEAKGWRSGKDAWSGRTPAKAESDNRKKADRKIVRIHV